MNIFKAVECLIDYSLIVNNYVIKLNISAVLFFTIQYHFKKQIFRHWVRYNVTTGIVSFDTHSGVTTLHTYAFQTAVS